MMIYSILQIKLISTKQCDSWLKFIFYIYPKQQQKTQKIQTEDEQWTSRKNLSSKFSLNTKLLYIIVGTTCFLCNHKTAQK